MGGPGAPRASTARRQARASTRPVALVTAGLVLLVTVAGVALALGRASLHAATEQRLADRADVVRSFYGMNDTRSGNDTYVERIEATGFSPTDAAQNEFHLTGFYGTRGGDEIRAKSVVRNDGTVVGQVPARTALPYHRMEEALAATRAGDVGTSRIFRYERELVWAKTYPVGGDEPWGAVVLVEPVGQGAGQTLYEGLGALSSADGGVTLVDSEGTAAFAWDRTKAGTRPFTDAELAALDLEPRTWRTEVGGETVVRIGITDPARPDSGSLVFEQPEEQLFGDLRQAQRQRDLVVVAVAITAVLALAGFTASRQRAVRRSEDRITLLMRNGHDVVLVVDDDQQLSFVSPAAATMLDQDPDGWLQRPFTDLVADEHVERVEAAVAQARREGRASLLGVRLRTGHGDVRWFDLALAHHDDPDVDGLLVTCQEVGDRKQLEDELAYRAGHDPLTGLANRARFESTLAELAALDAPLTVMLVDLDRFKQLNDSLGHDAGDIALRGVADGLRHAVRDGDLVGRLGGDEFAVVVPGVDESVAASIAERIRAGVRAAYPAVEGSLGLDASIGIAMAHGPLAWPELVVRDADAAMYEAKRGGGGRHVIVTIAPDDEGDTADAPVAARTAAAAPPAGDGAAPAPTAAGTPAAARVAAGATAPAARASLGDRLRSAAVLLVAAAITLGVAGVGAFESSRAQDASERRRIDERGRLAENLASVAAQRVDPALLQPIVSSTPWDRSSPELMAMIAKIYAENPTLGRNGMMAALEPDGEVIAVHPAGTPVPIDTGDPRWQAALEGEAYTPELIHDGERLYSYLVVPSVAPTGEVDLVAVLGFDIAESDWSATYQGIGAMGPGTGGALMVDGNGVASASWDASVVGDRVIDPAVLRGVAAGDVAVHHERTDGEDVVTLVTRIPLATTEGYVLWRQPAADLFGDLRAGQGARDVAVFGMLVLAILGLALVNRRREHVLRRNAARVDALLRQAHDLVLVTGPDGTVTYASAAVGPLFGACPDQVVGRPLEALIGEDPAGRVLAATVSAPPAAGRRGSVTDLEVVGPHGEQRLFDVDGANLLDQPEVGGFLLTFHEISERRALQDRLTAQATHDPLTGLANRAQFNARLDELAAARRSGAGEHAVVFIDLDHFKPVNDEFGHQAGDELLQTVARRLTAVVRATDVVCRLGGDEFAILLADCSEAQARETVQRLLDTVREPVAIGDALVSVDASIGVALSRSAATHPEQLVREADQAMYQAKRSGRGRYFVGA